MNQLEPYNTPDTTLWALRLRTFLAENHAQLRGAPVAGMLLVGYDMASLAHVAKDPLNGSFAYGVADARRPLLSAATAPLAEFTDVHPAAVRTAIRCLEVIGVIEQFRPAGEGAPARYRLTTRPFTYAVADLQQYATPTETRRPDQGETT